MRQPDRRLAAGSPGARLKTLVHRHLRISDRIVEMKAALDEGFAYDPLVAPHAENWLAVDEGERLALVRAYHRQAGLRLGTESQDNLRRSPYFPGGR